MLSLKQVIVNAVYKVSVDPKYRKEGDYDTPEEARADFIKGLIAELFPEAPDCPASTYVEPEEVKEKKKRAPKAKKEKTEEVKIEVPVVEAKAEEPKEKKKRAPKKEVVKPVEEKTEPIPEVKVEVPVVAKPEVKTEEPKEKKKRAPKKEKEAAPKKEKEPKNVEKLSPTDTKKLKAIAEEFKHEFEKKDILAYLNGLEKSVLDSKSLEEHAREFYAPKTEVEERELVAVEFKGEEYWVDVTTDPKKVYKTEGDVDVLVGHVGALEFKDMELPIME